MSARAGKKLLYIFDHTDWKSRIPIAAGAQSRGWEVTIGIIGTPQDTAMLKGFNTVFLPRPKEGLGPLAVLETVFSFRKLVRDTRADLVHTVTLKYAFLVGLATSFQRGYSVVYTLAGLGFLFRGEGIKPKILRAALSPLLKFVFLDRKAQIIFQNPDDQKLMAEMGYVRPHQTHLVISSGVDLEKFSSLPPPEDKVPLVLMPTRLVREKGIHIFIEAAWILKRRSTRARFAIAGGETKHNPRAISKGEMQALTADGTVEWLGRVEDMQTLLAQAAMVVYPSYYGEGVPRVLLEAAAAGRPIITTDHAGCREAVSDKISGLLVPVKDAGAVADAIEILLDDKEKRLEMGRQSRNKAEAYFDVKRIVLLTCDVYDEAIRPKL